MMMKDLMLPETPGKPGHPPKFTRWAIRRILTCVQRGLPLTLACNAAGLTFTTLSNHRKKNPRFALALQKAAARGAAARLKKIESASSSDWRAAAWLLEHTMPQHFAKSRIEVEAVGSLEHSFVIPRETLDQIAEARGRLERQQNENGHGQRLITDGTGA
jgi:hypothetical protein